jgi:hypothetical protein
VSIIPFSIHFQSRRLHFVKKKVEIVIPWFTFSSLSWQFPLFWGENISQIKSKHFGEGVLLCTLCCDSGKQLQSNRPRILKGATFLRVLKIKSVLFVWALMVFTTVGFLFAEKLNFWLFLWWNLLILKFLPVNLFESRLRHVHWRKSTNDSERKCEMRNRNSEAAFRDNL